MAKKKGGQRAKRQARQAKRARAEQQLAAVAAAEPTKGRKASAVQVKPKAQAPKEKKSDKPRLTQRAKTYLHEVKTELHRVVWPSPRELRNFSFAVIVLLIIFGIVVWLVDTGVVAGLVGYSGLRG